MKTLFLLFDGEGGDKNNVHKKNITSKKKTEQTFSPFPGCHHVIHDAI